MSDFHILNKITYPEQSKAIKFADGMLFFARSAFGYEDITFKEVENPQHGQEMNQVQLSRKVNNIFLRFLACLAAIALVVPSIIALIVKASLKKSQDIQVARIVNAKKFLPPPPPPPKKIDTPPNPPKLPVTTPSKKKEPIKIPSAPPANPGPSQVSATDPEKEKGQTKGNTLFLDSLLASIRGTPSPKSLSRNVALEKAKRLFWKAKDKYYPTDKSGACPRLAKKLKKLIKDPEARKIVIANYKQEDPKTKKTDEEIINLIMLKPRHWLSTFHWHYLEGKTLPDGDPAEVKKNKLLII